MRYGEVMTWQLRDRPLRVGFVLGLVFGVVNLLYTSLAPLSDDSIPALLTFYGPMFLSWAFVAFRSARRSGRVTTGLTTGFLVAFATFSTFYLMNVLRVNLFLTDLTGRDDWQNVMQRYRPDRRDNWLRASRRYGSSHPAVEFFNSVFLAVCRRPGHEASVVSARRSIGTLRPW